LSSFRAVSSPVVLCGTVSKNQSDVINRDIKKF
jgi:hypothetical protein